jgi:hypothetical protein
MVVPLPSKQEAGVRFPLPACDRSSNNFLLEDDTDIPIEHYWKIFLIHRKTMLRCL